MEWIKVNSTDSKDLVKEVGIKEILVSHEFGIDAIHYFGGKWTFWYTTEVVSDDIIKSITHYCEPKKS